MERLIALTQHADPIVAVDSIPNLDELSAAAHAASAEVRVVIEVDIDGDGLLDLYDGGYANFLAPDAHEQIASAYGVNAGRLRSLKGRFDPADVFTSAIPLPV